MVEACQARRMEECRVGLARRQGNQACVAVWIQLPLGLRMCIVRTREWPMARELTIQIRLSKEEHELIAAQAAKEGLGVGTFLRALALRKAWESSPTPRGDAFRA